MLRRNSARNQQRRPLSRSKSTNSVPPSPIRLLDIIDPAVAERDAHLAALISYHKSQHLRLQQVPSELQDQPRGVMEKNGVALGPTDQGLDRRGSARDRKSYPGGASGIRRQKSVRFVGPDARPRRALASRATEFSTESCATTSGLDALGNMNNRPESTPSHPGQTVDPHGITRRYLESLQAASELYTPEDDAASMPSTYQRLRKSKSMFSTFNAPSTRRNYHNGVSDTEEIRKPGNGAVMRMKENDCPTAKHPPRPSTSLSILKRRRSTMASHSTSRAQNELAIQLAREQFRDQAQAQAQNLLKPRPSIFFGSKNKRSESALGFRKSLRSSSNNSTALSSTFSGHSLSLPKQTGLRTTARKVSQNLRTKLKGLFNRPKSTPPPESEAQDGQRDIHGFEGESCVLPEEVSIPTEASVLRVPSHVPSLHAVSSTQELRSRRGSVESIGSVEKRTLDDKSRVTSWTDSITNTASSAEDGEFHRHLMTRQSALHTLSSSLAQKQSLSQRQSSASLLIDNQKVCSALVKRMQEIKSREEELNHVVGSIKARRNVPMDAISDGGWNEPTIRCVRAEDDVFGSHDNETTVDEAHDLSEHIINRQPSPRESLNVGEDDASATRRRFEANNNENALMTITQRSSAFFASPTCHLFRTASPYRRALRESMKSSGDQGNIEAAGSRYLRSLSEINLPMRRLSDSGSEKDARVACSESIYSCRSEDNEQPPLVAENSGTATIFTKDFARKLSFQHRRDISTASSVEWKTWLSANVSKLEDSDAARKMGRGENQRLSPPARGHVRELAEIDSSQDEIKLLGDESNGSPIRSPLGSVQDNTRSNPIALPSYTDLSKTNTLCDENEAPGVASSNNWKGDLPLLPPRNQLRPSSSVSECQRDEQFFNTVNRTNFSASEAQIKRHARQNIANQVSSSAKSSPGLTSAIERQFLHRVPGSPARRAGCNTSQSTPRSRKRAEVRDEDGKSHWEKDSDLNTNTPVMGSKKMVDMFLDSRRKRILGDITKTEPGSSPTAFL